MLLVETYISETKGKGFGLFTKTKILKGTTYWIRNEFFDHLFIPQIKDNFPRVVIEYIEKYGFQEITGNWYLCGDNARFTNHSLNPNFINHYNESGLVDYCYTDRDINVGEEIVCNYFDTCQTCVNGLPFKEILN